MKNTSGNTNKNSENSGLSHVRNAGIATLASGAALTAVTMAAANYLVKQITRPTPINFLEKYTFSPFELQVDFERVKFPTADNSIIEGWLFPRPNSSKVVLSLSGYRGRKEDMLGISAHLWRHDYNVLLFDYRGYGQGRTKSDILTLGPRELEDFQAALNYVRIRFEKPLIGTIGGSMGAAVSLVAAAREKDIMAVWSDSAFASQRDVIAHGWKDITHLPVWPVVNLAEKLFELRTGYDWREIAPVNEIAKIAPRPVYIVHSASDSIAPVKDAYALYEAAGSPKELWIEDNLEHCGIYFSNREEYSSRVLSFFDKNLVTSEVAPLAQAV